MEERKQILECMYKRLGEILNIDSSTLNEDTTFASLNMKSVNYSQLTTTLEDAFDVEIPYMNFKRKATLGEAADYVITLLES